MAGRVFVIAILGLGACQSPRATAPVTPEPLFMHSTLTSTAGLLAAVADLRRDVDQAIQLGRALERTRTRYTGWLSDGTMSLVASDLERRRRNLWVSESRFVRASMAADVIPALERLTSGDLEDPAE